LEYFFYGIAQQSYGYRERTYYRRSLQTTTDVWFQSTETQRKSDSLTLLIEQFKSPIVLILLAATGLSLFLHNIADASIIFSIVILSGLLGYWQEHSASVAVEKLLAMVQIKAAVLRDGKQVEISVESIVPGDIVILNAGDIVPGDCLVLESKVAFVDEAMLTGETYPAEKTTAILPADTTLAQRTNALWMGTHLVSGYAKALVVLTGKNTEFGKVSERLQLKAPETEFERGIRRFGYFLGEVTLVLVIAIFAINVYLQRPVLEAFLFSLALAVGLTLSFCQLSSVSTWRMGPKGWLKRKSL